MIHTLNVLKKIQEMYDAFVAFPKNVAFPINKTYLIQIDLAIDLLPKLGTGHN